MTNSMIHPFTPADEEEKLAYELWTRIALDAITERSSDIHFEPFRFESHIRYRVDGVLQVISRQTNDSLQALLRVIKKSAGMNPDGSDIPQTGKILFSSDKTGGGEKTWDIRLSTFPTIFGEKLVCRVLDPGSGASVLKGDLSLLGLEGRDLELITGIINKPYGMVAFCGPTGSGKTSTVYAALSLLAKQTENRCHIVTLEEPVEFTIDGVVQSNVDSEGDFNYYRALKALMRQDPDIIFLAGVPDRDTASMALQAALTGHLIMLQLNSSDTAYAIHSMFEMGMEPYLVSMCIEGIISQRLFRKICPDCKQKVSISREVIDRIREDVENPDSVTHVWRGAGCEKCRGTGYRGRMAVYEILPGTVEIREFIAKKPGLAEMREKFKSLGYPTLRKAAIKKALNGETTLEEAIRCACV
ncbi:MAG: GspE/PulE family protein [Firmicutes bacterium]|nr:GspE/PulE family protein [Bacillota bacterium]